jgi:orotate phosphoribosyltransferase
MQEYEVAKILLKIGAVSLRPSHPFLTASGWLSPINIDCRIINSFPKERNAVLNYIYDYIDMFIGRNNVELVVGSGHSGISLAAYVVDKMRLPMAYIRASSKTHGKGNKVEGLLKKGIRAVLISDIIDDEEHVPQSVELLKEQGVEIVHLISIFNMKLNIVDPFLKREGINYFTLTDLRILLNTAVADKLISLSEREEIERWRQDFRHWGEKRKEQLDREFAQLEKDVAETLLRIRAVALSPNEPYRYTSGILSPIYCDNRLLISYPDDWQLIIEGMLKIIVNIIGMENIDIIGGTSTAGIPHAAQLAERLMLPMIYIKSSPETHGKQTIIEGKLEPGMRVLVIEDLISTGGSSIKAVESVRDAGGLVDHCLAIFTYQMQQSLEAFRKASCTLYTLSNFATLMKVAKEKEYITEEEHAKAIEWNRNPEAWGIA